MRNKLDKEGVDGCLIYSGISSVLKGRSSAQVTPSSIS